MLTSTSNVKVGYYDERWAAGMGHIRLNVKQTGAPDAGNPHVRCDVAGAGNVQTKSLRRASPRPYRERSVLLATLFHASQPYRARSLRMCQPG